MLAQTTSLAITIGQISIYLLKLLLLLLLYSLVYILQTKAALGLSILPAHYTFAVSLMHQDWQRQQGLKGSCVNGLMFGCCSWERVRRVREGERVTAVDVSVPDR